MSCWRLWLTVLLLLALPLKGLAGVGALGCEPLPAPPVSQVLIEGPVAHEAHTSQHEGCAQDEAAAPPQAGADDTHTPGPCAHHAAPCCLNLAPAADLVWSLAQATEPAPPAPVAVAFHSVHPQGLERPPRT